MSKKVNTKIEKIHKSDSCGDNGYWCIADEFSRFHQSLLALYRSVGNHDEGGSDSGRKEQGSR